MRPILTPCANTHGLTNLSINMTPPLVRMAQCNFAVGDIVNNRRLLLKTAQQAQQDGALAMLSPELALSGYCPDDLLYDYAFMNAVHRELQILIAEAPPLPLIIGLPWREDDKLYDAAALIVNGKLIGVYKKVFLPNTSVFDERRYFIGGDNPPLTFESGGTTFAIQICADVWEPAQAKQVSATRADWTLSLNASPFHNGKHQLRLHMAKAFTQQSGGGLFYCNTVGGQDELIFDGASFVMDKTATVRQQLPAFTTADKEKEANYPESLAAAYTALVLGVRDYVAKTGFANGVILGLSGGIDSALTAAIAADAIGGQNVLALSMPSRHTAAISQEDAAAVANNIGAQFMTIPITPLIESLHGALSAHILPRKNDTTMENIQARLRGQLLMALANNRGLLLLATGNKSELACGYATLYGDMCGGFAPLKDVDKTTVWALAKYRNRQTNIIPERTIARAPTAELRDNQTDQQTLPPYSHIDAAINAHIENRQPRDTWTPDVGEEIAARFLELLTAGEHKRRQAAIGPKITNCAFGRDWRMPIANRFRYDD